MIEKQRNLESLLKKDKKRQQHQWLSSMRKQLANSAIDYLAEIGNIKELPHWNVKRKCFFSKGFSNAVNNSGVFVFTLFEKGDKPTRCDQGIISGNIKTIDFTGAVCSITMEMKTKFKSKSKIKGSTKLDAETNTKLGKETSTKTSIKLGPKPSTKTSFKLESEPNTKLGSKTSAKKQISLLLDCSDLHIKWKIPLMRKLLFLKMKVLYKLQLCRKENSLKFYVILILNLLLCWSLIRI